jgi:predicted amidophosphoribosyltransferase
VIAASSDFLILCWFAAAVVGGMIGVGKGRAFAGALWGLLLGPLGWLVIAAAPDQWPKCPECGGDVIRGAIRCKNCGHRLKLRAQSEVKPPIEAVLSPEKTTPAQECPGCSSVMINGICSLCGFAETSSSATDCEPLLIKVEPGLTPSVS